MSRHRCYVLLLLGAVAAFALLAASSADAIPAFARKHQLSCCAYHAPFPRLTPFGEEFAARGFLLPPDRSRPAPPSTSGTPG